MGQLQIVSKGMMSLKRNLLDGTVMSYRTKAMMMLFIIITQEMENCLLTRTIIHLEAEFISIQIILIER